MAKKSGGKAARVQARMRHAQGASVTENPAVSNPFEQRDNRPMHSTALLRRVRGANRNVAIARSRAVDRRQKDLLREWKALDSQNQFVDRRVGEYDPSMTEEERALARFRLERMQRASANASRKAKSSKFNLADVDGSGSDHENQLTHMGRPIRDLGAMDRHMIDRDDDDHDSDKDREPMGTFNIAPPHHLATSCHV